MELKYALSVSSTRKRTLTYLDMITHLNNQPLVFPPKWFFHADLQIILGNVDVTSCLKAAVPKLKNPTFFF